MADFDLERLGPQEFEHLVQGLCIAALGARTCVFGEGPDGGREATIAGPLTWDGGRGEADAWDGYTVVQAKFRGRQGEVPANFRWLKGEIRKELARWTEDRYARSLTRRPDNLLIVTNVRLSAAAGGGIDAVNEEISRLVGAYCPGLRWRLWHYDDLRAQLTAHAGVRAAFPALITPGDVLAAFARAVQSPAASAGLGGRPRLICELTDPFALEVHRAIDADRPAAGLPLLPLYVKREHDARLAEAVRRAAGGQSTIAVLVGGPATGKTRACWEAVQALPEGWRLWHPISPDRPEAALGELPAVGPRTVVWLNEAQFYLLTPGSEMGERVAAGLREIMRAPERGPVLVLGTMWPEHWGRAVASARAGAQDCHAQARALLDGSAIDVPETFAGAAVRALRDAAPGDPRLAQAAREARDGQITQYLAGVPALLERYGTAPAAARALIHAAMDARRLGHGPALPDAFLMTAVPGYLTDAQWNVLPEDWLEQAMAFAEAPCRGASGLVPRIRSRDQRAASAVPPCHRLNDYLERLAYRSRVTEAPPETFWVAALQHARSPHDMAVLGDAAQSRWRARAAARLYEQAASMGSTWAMLSLARMREEAGDTSEAERLYQAVIDARPHHQQEGVHEQQGRDRHAFDADVARRHLLQLREKAGDQAGAERLALETTDNGAALRLLASMRHHAGDVAGAARLYQLAADAGSTWSMLALGDIRKAAGDRHEAGRLYQLAADAGDLQGMVELARMQEEAGNHAEANRVYQAAADAGSVAALDVLALMHEKAGHREEAERLARIAADTSVCDTHALSALVRTRARAGEETEVDRLAQAAADAGDPRAMLFLAQRREADGNQDEAERLHEMVIGSGDTWAMALLAKQLEQAGKHAGAERVARVAADAGDPKLLKDLALRNAHDTRWQQMLQYGLEADGSISKPW